MRSLLLVLAASLSFTAKAAVQTITCEGIEVHITFKIPDRGRVTSRYKKNSIKNVGANVVVTGEDKVGPVGDEGTATMITFPRANLGAVGPFTARGEFCASDCVSEPVNCLSEVK